jgi:hypothetical protein
MRASEWITLGYLAILAGVALLRRLPAGRRWFVCAATGGLALVVAGIAAGEAVSAVGAIRNWAPVLYLLGGYWIPSALVRQRNDAFERALHAVDRRWLGEDPRGVGARLPRPVLELLEAAYLSCYPVLPLGAGILIAGGLEAQIDRYWTAVLLAGFLSYVALPWTAARPPREIEVPADDLRSTVRRLNVATLARASVQLNTFPSGHVATSLAAALAVGAVLPAPGVAMGLVASGIAVGSVVGRYHYAADVPAGVAVAVAAWAVSRLV